MLIWIASYPRSGNTFFRHVLTQIYRVASFEKYAWGPDHTPLALEGFEQLAKLNLSLAEMRESSRPYFIKTHDLPDDDSPAVYLVRDGRDALISHAHFVLEYDLKVENPGPIRFRETLRALIETDSSFGGWSENVRAWTSRSAPTAIVRFEDLVSDPQGSVRRAMGELAFPSPQTPVAGLLTFDELRRSYPTFFRQGKVGSWRKEMPHDLHELFWQRHGGIMRRIGYRPPRLRMLWWSMRTWVRSLSEDGH
jgi:hypothetical protein